MVYVVLWTLSSIGMARVTKRGVKTPPAMGGPPVTRSPDRIVVACSCEGTMPLDEGALARGCGEGIRTADHLCRRQLDVVRTLLGTGAPLTIGCTQEAPLFTQIAEEMGAADRIVFTNVREQAGWSKDALAAGPKMAGLLAAAAES